MSKEKAQKSDISVVILAAGKGTRMKSNLSKVLHAVGGKPMLLHVMDVAEKLAGKQVHLVLAPDQQEVKRAALAAHKHTTILVQDKQLGTGHAVRMAEEALKNFSGNVLILYGDTPLITRETCQMLLSQLSEKTPIAVLGMNLRSPGEYGRLVINKKNELERIVEFKDANEEERHITLCNSGVMAARAEVLFKLLAQIKNKNAKNEYYLTDIVALAHAAKHRVVAVETQPLEVTGVNSRRDLTLVEYHFQTRMRLAMLDAGVTMIAAETVFFSADTKIGQDTIIHPFVTFGPGVVVDNGVEIRSFCHLEETKVGAKAVIGPYARLRPGANIGKNAHIGNFVEIKKSDIGNGAKINHLSYVGDASVGDHANIGAGTITCNYDGFDKFRTEIGAGAFIGSNTALIAPVTIGKGAVVGAGSAITEDVEPDSLAIARPKQLAKKDWAKQFRNRRNN